MCWPLSTDIELFLICHEILGLCRFLSLAMMRSAIKRKNVLKCSYKM